jgi:predicted SprT family Zn-dependent metalloprotease
MLTIGSRSRRIKEILCHEAAHLAVFLKHGNHAKPHGPEWQKLVQKAGFEVKTALSAEILKRGDIKKSETKTVYLHTCTVCGSSRIVKKPMPNWRCFSCREEGMEGTLQITSQPSTEVNL